MKELEELKANYKELGASIDIQISKSKHALNLASGLSKGRKELALQIEEFNKPKGRWKPEVGETIFMISAIGGPLETKCTLCPAQGFYYDMGLMFKTSEETKKAQERMLATQRVLDIIAEERGDWRPKWGNLHACFNELLAWDHQNNCLGSRHELSHQTRPNSYYYGFGNDIGKKIKARISDTDAKLFCGVE